MSINNVRNTIDSLLDRAKWTAKEFDFYHMLVSKVKEYQEKGRDHLDNKAEQPLKDISEDVKEIYNNIIHQIWYKLSDNKGTLAKLLHNMKIVKCIHTNNVKPHNYHYILDILLQDTIHLVINVARETEKYTFRVYYEYNGNIGHIAALIPGQAKSLPEYNCIEKIFPTLKRHESICLALELVLYYDVDHIMMKLPIGNNYPITMHQLMSGIVHGLKGKP